MEALSVWILAAYGSSSISIDRNVNLFLSFLWLHSISQMWNNALNNHLLNFALFTQSTVLANFEICRMVILLGEAHDFRLMITKSSNVENN